ncbi:MAG TPA: 4-hydroxy-tetrahydrodipicolinate synthase [Solirubrobacteraceae bacterium]
MIVEGLLVPLVTPFDARGEVDVGALERLAVAVLDAGADGLVALATTGEASSLDEREREAVIAVCADVARARDVVLLVGAGTNDTRTTIARHEALGDVDGVAGSLAVVPYYVRPSEAAIVAHFEAVAARSPVPLVLYNIPYRTGRGLGAEALLALAEVDGVVGVKQAVGALDADTLSLLAGAPEDFAVLCGDDAFMLPILLMGGAGAIAASAHLCTERFVALLASAREGRAADARLHAEALLSLVLALFAEPSPAVLKGVLHAHGRIATPDVRMPLGAASAPAVERAVAACGAARGEPTKTAPSRSTAPAPARAR